MVSRRKFLRQLAGGLAAAALPWPGTTALLAAEPQTGPLPGRVRVAVLADAHLQGDPSGRARAQRLAEAVAAIRACRPPVDLVCCLGDLTGDDRPQTLGLAREIMAALPAPCCLVPGEHDPPEPVAWPGLEAAGSFCFAMGGVFFCGLDTRSNHGPAERPQFRLPRALLRSVATTIQKLPPEQPLVLLSHAPLYPLFPAWQWQTAGAEDLYPLLPGHRQVVLLHGHVHQHIVAHWRNLQFVGGRATSWPLPEVRLGSLEHCPEPGEGRDGSGCGWLLLTFSDHGRLTVADQVWTS